MAPNIASKKTLSRKPQSQQPGVGGREFGQIIEPAQAQMASGNRGLADDTASQSRPNTRSPRKPRKAA